MKKILSLWAFCLMLSASQAQSTVSILGLTPVLEVDTLTGLVQPVDLTTQSFNLKTFIKLSDSSSVQNIHIKIGRQVDSSDVVDLVIPYQSTSLPTEIVSIEKEGYFFRVNFGSFTNIYTLHLAVWAEDQSGSLSRVFQKRLN